MPIEGEIRRDRDIQLGNKYIKLIWLACSSCGKYRWVRLADAEKPNFTGLCHQCLLRARNGKGHLSPNWKGGVKRGGGYIWIFLTPDSPFYAMANRHSYVKRPRLIMAQHLGRCLKPEEEIHHSNEVKTDDVYENLTLFPNKASHISHHRRNEILAGRERRRNSSGQFINGGS